MKYIKLDKWISCGKKKKIKSSCVSIKKYDFDKKLEDYLLLFMIEASRFIELSKTTLFKLIYYAQEEGFFKISVIPNIYHHGIMPKDINLKLKKLEKENKFSYVQKEIYNYNLAHTSETKQWKLEKAIVINPQWANNSEEIASRLGISLPDMQRKIRGLIRRLPMRPTELAKKNKKDLIKLIKDKKRYHYSHWPDLDEHPTICIRDNMLSLTKIKINFPIIQTNLEFIIKKDPVKKSIKVAEKIIDIKETLVDSLLDIEAIWRDYKNRNYWEKIKGCVCLIGVVFTKIVENNKGFIILEASDSLYNRNSKTIKVIFKKDGLNSDLMWEQVLYKIYYLLGEIDSSNGEPIIKGRALIYQYDINSEIISYLKKLQVN
jgi:hypothetical protein